MIVGKGSIAKMLNDREGAIFFASGVSNSQHVNLPMMMREADLLWEYANDKKCLFYFSSIVKKDTAYGLHKLAMEERVKSWFDNYCIIRIGNVWECTNPNTFRNYISNHPEAEVRDEIKYMISKKQLLLITDNMPLVGKNEISVFGEMKKVKDCL